MKKAIISSSLILLLTACGDNQQPTAPTIQTVNDEVDEVEDCDAGDLLEGDEDCYGVDLKVKKSKKTKAIKTANKKKSSVAKGIKKVKVNKSSSFKSSKSSSSLKSSSSKKRR